MRLKLTREAHDDYAAILTYIHERNSSGARNVMAAIDRALDLIAEYPESGKTTERPPVRMLPVPRYPYKIFYQLTANVIEVFHIRHAARRPWEDA